MPLILNLQLNFRSNFSKRQVIPLKIIQLAFVCLSNMKENDNPQLNFRYQSKTSSKIYFRKNVHFGLKLIFIRLHRKLNSIMFIISKKKLRNNTMSNILSRYCRTYQEIRLANFIAYRLNPKKQNLRYYKSSEKSSSKNRDVI